MYWRKIIWNAGIFICFVSYRIVHLLFYFLIRVCRTGAFASILREIKLRYALTFDVY
jgi:hypothetical protein